MSVTLQPQDPIHSLTTTPGRFVFMVDGSILLLGEAAVLNPFLYTEQRTKVSLRFELSGPHQPFGNCTACLRATVPLAFP